MIHIGYGLCLSWISTLLMSYDVIGFRLPRITFMVESLLISCISVHSKFMDRVISVEYATRDDDDKRNGYSPDRRGRDGSPDGRRGYGRGGRSPSPYQRDRGSPDYGHGAAPNSRAERRSSPDYGRATSPVNDRYQRYFIFIYLDFASS